MDTNIIKGLFASITDVIGGRSGVYEKEHIHAKEITLREVTEHAQEMGTNAIVGVDLDFETVGERGQMLMVSVNRTPS